MLKGSYSSLILLQELNEWFISNVSVNCFISKIVNIQFTVYLLQQTNQKGHVYGM